MRIKFMSAGVVAAALSLLPMGGSFAAPKAKKHVLVVTVTKGFRHDSIGVAEETIQKLGVSTGDWDTDFVRTDDEMRNKMTASALKRYDALIFANTTGVLPLPEPKALLDFVASGKGFAAMHSGSDTLHQFPGDPRELKSLLISRCSAGSSRRTIRRARSPG